MMNTYLTHGKYDTLARTVQIQFPNFELSTDNIKNELIKYYAKNKWVYIRINGELKPAGKLLSVSGLHVVIEIADNSYGSFIRHMLYRAVDYKIGINGIGQVSGTNQLKNFKISSIIITDFSKWF